MQVRGRPSPWDERMLTSLAGEQLWHVVAVAQEVNAVADAELGGELLELGLHPAATSQLQVVASGQQGHGAQECGVVLVRGHAGDHDEAELRLALDALDGGIKTG